MVQWIETTGRTEEDAIAAALFQLGLERDDVSVEVVERAKSGFLGFGGNPAKVRVSYEVSEEGGKPQPMKDEFKLSVFDEPAPAKKEQPKAAPAIVEEKKAPKPERPQLSANTLIGVRQNSIHRASRILSIRFFIFYYLRFRVCRLSQERLW